jgi:transposase-like protein
MMRQEVLIGVERRRRWSIEQKLQILGEVGVNGATVSDVGRQHDITRQHLYQWRRELRRRGIVSDEPAQFLPIEFAGNETAGRTHGFAPDRRPVEIGLRNGRTVRAAADIADSLLARLNTSTRRSDSSGMATNQPSLSIRKKKELVGDFKNGGRELRPKGDPQPVRVHDFEIPALGKVAPYGVYDIAANAGLVNLGTDHDTAAKSRYPDATSLLITADCGGSNGFRVRLWKRELQAFVNETGLSVTVVHHPPAPANGIASNIGSLRSSRRTGVASR